MKIATQRQLIYLATRLYPDSRTFDDLASTDIKLLGQKHLIGRVAQQTYIGDNHLNEVFDLAFKQSGAEGIFNAINSQRINLTPQQIRTATYKAFKFDDLKPLLPKTLRERFRLNENFREKFLDTLVEITDGSEFVLNDTFQFPRFWRHTCTVNRLCGNEKLSPLEALDHLSVLLDFGVIEVDKILPGPVQFRLMALNSIYESLADALDVDNKAQNLLDGFGKGSIEIIE